VLVVLAILLLAEAVLGVAGDLVLIALGLSGFLWASIFAVLIRGYLSNPRSRHTGKPLLKFRDASPCRDSLVEILDVCPGSRTCFVPGHPNDG
jgi:hypothetical protein